MSPHAYTEDQLVERPAVALFGTLGWHTLSALDETFGANGLLARETKGEVVLLSRLRATLKNLNPALPSEAIASAIDELTRDRSAMSLEAANREVYKLIKDGIAVSVPDRQHGGQKSERVQVIDWATPTSNDFLLVSQLSVTGDLYTCRPDLVGFVNGLPWVVIEFKKVGVPARAAFDENLTHYKASIPALCWYNALFIASNGTNSRVGSLTADWDRFFEWKRVAREDEPRRVSLEVMLRGTCDPARLLDLVENFTLFSEHKAGMVKILGQNHQYLGVNNAIASMLEARERGHGRAGVFWQTQGSGKSFSMVFFAQKVLRTLTGNWTFVIVTDRVELDEQIAKTFKATGAVSPAEGDACHAVSGAHLRELLRQGDGRLDRQGDRAQDARQGEEALGCRNRARRARASRGRVCDRRGDQRGARPSRRADGGAQAATLGAPDDRHGGDRLTRAERDRANVLELLVEPRLRVVHTSAMRLDVETERAHTEDPLRMVFVCAMWLTGFDAPSCSTVYLDKPMRNHTLMQTIARANRVFPGKHSGVIVDYANVFASLEKALAIYGTGKGGTNPVRDKQQLVEELRKAISDATAFCGVHGVTLSAIEALAPGGLERLQALEDAINALISPDALRREFFGHERLVVTLYRAVKPDPCALEFAGRVACLATVAEAIRVKLSPDQPDISAVMAGINTLLDGSITGLSIRDQGPPALDLSKINFEALARRFKESKHKNTELESLKAAIRARLNRMIQINATRADFAEKFEALIESYNSGSRSIEELFDELVKLSNSLNKEQARHVRENLTEEELVIFDILTRPAPELSTDERTEVKKVTRELLTRLKTLLVLNWRQKAAARSQLKLTIEDTLDSGLPRAYTPELYQQKCSAVFEHVYESYPERDSGVYARIG